MRMNRVWLALAALGVAAGDAVAQTSDSGWELGISVGQGLTSAEARSAGGLIWLCDESGAFLNQFEFEIGKEAFAARFSFNHETWPWPWLGAEGDETSSPPNVLIRHGNAFEALALLRPAELVDLQATHREGYTFNPVVGVGVQRSFDASDDSPASADVYQALGRTSLLLAYGFNLDVHPGGLRDAGIALRVGLTGKHMFRSETTFDTPTGEQTFETGDGDWATVTFGVVFRPGS